MIRGLAFLEIVVNDLDAALDWYTRILGFKLSGKIVSNEDGRWCRLAISESDDHLALWQPPHPLSHEEKIHQSFIPVFAVDDLKTLVEQLKTENVTMLEGIRERTGYRITTIADPDGNRLQLFETTTFA